LPEDALPLRQLGRFIRDERVLDLNPKIGSTGLRRGGNANDHYRRVQKTSHGRTPELLDALDRQWINRPQLLVVILRQTPTPHSFLPAAVR
jgi:hypothetical protein